MLKCSHCGKKISPKQAYWDIRKDKPYCSPACLLALDELTKLKIGGIQNGNAE